MENEKELVIRMAEAEQEAVAAVNRIMAKHDLPCFLFEPILDKIHHQLIDGKTAELAQAQAQAKARSHAKEEANDDHA